MPRHGGTLPRNERVRPAFVQNARNGAERLGGHMTFTLSQAAKAARKSKSTISLAIEKGRLSVTRLPSGEFQIEPAELFRVFPQRTPDQAERPSVTQAGTVPERASKPPERTDETAVLRERLLHLEAALAHERAERAAERAKDAETIADLRKSRDDFVAAFPKQLAPPVRRRWWPW